MILDSVAMNLAEAVQYCLCLGLIITKDTLYRYIRSKEFVCFQKTKAEKGTATIYSDELTHFVEMALEEPPEGWITVSEAVEKYSIPRSYLESEIDKDNVLARYYGIGKGIMYVRERDAKKINR